DVGARVGDEETLTVAEEQVKAVVAPRVERPDPGDGVVEIAPTERPEDDRPPRGARRIGRPFAALVGQAHEEAVLRDAEPRATLPLVSSAEDARRGGEKLRARRGTPVELVSVRRHDERIGPLHLMEGDEGAHEDAIIGRSGHRERATAVTAPDA